MVLAVIGAGYFMLAKTPFYESSASLWVDTTPPVASSVGSDSAVLTSSPSAAEQGLLTELLTTQTFAVDVAKNSLLGHRLTGKGPAAAASAIERGQVTATVTGGQVLKIAYSGPTPAVATSVLGAVVTELQQDSAGFSAQRNQAAVTYDKSQVTVAAKQLASARRQVAAYLAQHPRANISLDPNLSSLISTQDAANSQYAQANAALSQAMVNTRDGGGWMVELIDRPSAPLIVPQSKKKMLEVLLGALLGGALVSFFATMMLTPGRQELWEDEATEAQFVDIPVPPSAGDAGGFVRAPASTEDGGSFAQERHFALPSPHENNGKS